MFENRIETMHFHKAQAALCLMTTLFHIKGAQMNSLATMKIVLGCKARQVKLDARLYERERKQKEKHTRKYPCKLDFNHIKVGFELWV